MTSESGGAMSEREEVLREFGVDELVRLLPMPVSESVSTLADEIVRLRSQLAAAEKVVGAAIRYIDGDVNDPWGYQEDDRYDDLWEAVTDEKDRRARAKEARR